MFLRQKASNIINAKHFFKADLIYLQSSSHRNGVFGYRSHQENTESNKALCIYLFFGLYAIYFHQAT